MHLTGKNKEQFISWYVNKDWNLKSDDDYISVFDFLDNSPFEMQIGVYLAYYDSVGLFISTETNWSKVDKMDYCYSVESNEVGFGISGFNSRNEAYKEAFKKADEIANSILK